MINGKFWNVLTLKKKKKYKEATKFEVQTKSWCPLVVQWLRLHTSNAGCSGLIPGWGNKILHAMQHGQKIQKQNPKHQVWIHPKIDKSPADLVRENLNS